MVKQHERVEDISILLMQASTKIRVIISNHVPNENELRFLKSALESIETTLVHITHYANVDLFKKE